MGIFKLKANVGQLRREVVVGEDLGLKFRDASLVGLEPLSDLRDLGFDL